MRLMDTVFANADFWDEAAFYIFHGITERENVEADIRKWAKKYNATEEDIQEYTDNIMDAMKGYTN